MTIKRASIAFRPSNLAAPRARRAVDFEDVRGVMACDRFEDCSRVINHVVAGSHHKSNSGHAAIHSTGKFAGASRERSMMELAYEMIFHKKYGERHNK